MSREDGRGLRTSTVTKISHFFERFVFFVFGEDALTHAETHREVVVVVVVDALNYYYCFNIFLELTSSCCC